MIKHGIDAVKKQLNDTIECLGGNLEWGSDGVWQREIHYINALSFALEEITGERYKRCHIVGDREVEWR